MFDELDPTFPVFVYLPPDPDGVACLDGDDAGADLHEDEDEDKDDKYNDTGMALNKDKDEDEDDGGDEDMDFHKD